MHTLSELVDEAVLDAKQLDSEDEGGVRGNDGRVASNTCKVNDFLSLKEGRQVASHDLSRLLYVHGDSWKTRVRTISQVRRNGQLSLLRDAHVEQALIPALDHLSCAD